MKTLHFHILLFAVCLVASCAKKKYPDDVVINTAVYKFNGLIENQPVSIAAGVNNYYMYSSYGQDADGVYNFIGDLKPLDCTNCPNSLKIQINDLKISAQNAPMVLDSVLIPRHAAFVAPTPDGYLAQFHAVFNKTAASYDWDFGDGAHSSLADPQHAYAKPGYYAVSLKITSSNGCQSTIRQYQKIAAEPDGFVTYISAKDTGSSILFIPTIRGGQAPYQYLWNFGDNGPTSPAVSPSHHYSETGSYLVSLRVTDAKGETAVIYYNAVTSDDHSSCAANFQILPVTKVTYPAGALSLSKIIVSWRDANGAVYSSDMGDQPADSRFEITSVENAGMNENNMPMKKLHIVFSCKAYNGSSAITINNAEATISVAYK